jgi:hypothetical protein
MDQSPTARLMKLKRQSAAVQAQRLDMNSILLHIDNDLKLRKTRKSNNNQNDDQIQLNFFDKLEEISSHTNLCPPGSLLPLVPTNKRSLQLEPFAVEFNATHRSVGYSSPPQAPYHNLSQTRYMTNLHKKMIKIEQPTWRKKSPKRKASSVPKSKSKASLKPGELTEEETMLKSIMSLHQKAVQRAARLNKKRSVGSTGYALFDAEKQTSKMMLKKKLSDALIYDADTSVQTVVAREQRRLERLTKVQSNR